jgi:type IV pilus assembly protein PilN
MRLDINLATRPYRDVRQFLRTWGTGTVLLALLTAGLCWYTFHAWSKTRSARAEVALVQNEIDTLNRQRESGIALLNQPQNRAVANQSAFLNGLIARRSFSWTMLFMELERIMPARLHVTSIAPSLNKRNQIEIHMVVAGDARDQAVELVRRLEDSPSFQQPELRSETLAQNTPGAPILAGGDRVQFDITMLYVPKATPEQAAADKGPQPQTANDDKAAKPVTDKVAKPDTAKTDGDKTLRPAGDKSDKKKKDHGAQTDSAANAKAAGGKGVAR